MKLKSLAIVVHVIGWFLLLLVPYITTYQHIKTYLTNSIGISVLPVVTMGIINISIFYVNYFFLIPRFLFSKKYLAYGLSLTSCFLFSFVVGILLFRIAEPVPSDAQGVNAVLTMIRHTAQANMFQMLVVCIAASVALSYGGRMKQIEQEKLSAQIASLRSQINPHFLFNTLNSIYATTLETSPASADMVEKLSDMMRYTMKDTQSDLVMLEDEINYNNNYIALQRIRLDKSVKIDYRSPNDVEPLQIAPMLLIPFIENAFKHGVNPEEESHIRVDIEVQHGTLRLLVANNKVMTQKETTEKSGLGIENTRGRLQMIYPDTHRLIINESEKHFEVFLSIDLR